MPAAAIGGIVAGVGAIGGALISSGAQKDAASQAAAANAQSVAAQKEIAARQEALYRDIYKQNTENFNPYLTSGYGAQAVAMQMLGLKPLTAQQFNTGQWYQPGTVDYTPPAQPAPGTGTGAGAGTGTGTPTNPATPAYTGPTMAEIMAMKNDGVPGNYQAALAAYQAAHPKAPHGQRRGNGGAGTPTPTLPTQTVPNFPSTPSGGAAPQPAPNPSAVTQQALVAIASGADPAAVRARAAEMGVQF